MRQSATTRWINKHYYVNLTDNDYIYVKNFLLLWNLFENNLFDNNFTISAAEGKINNFIEKGKIDEKKINKIFNYFQQRYTNNGILSFLFSGLHFRLHDRMDFVECTIIDKDSSLFNKTLAIMIIVFRYRNNLFHGLKDITLINYQKDNFRHANSFLMLMLEIK